MRYKATLDHNYIDHPCCHEAVVIDMMTPTMIGKKVYRPCHTVCECYTRENAIAIADALNRGDFKFEAFL